MPTQKNLQTLRTIAELRAWSRVQRSEGRSVGLVPTMGALHNGHRSLLERAVAAGDAVVASIFVNPTQFGPKEDFASYPRRFEADCALLRAAGAEAVFAPAVEEMYPEGASTYVDVGALSERLDGLTRAGHFRGVATVVSKLLIAAEPNHAYFGQKDAAQVAVLRKLVRDLGFGTELVVCPIVREADGLALSSRNAYLSARERQQALVLSSAIHMVEKLVAEGQRSAKVLVAAARAAIAREPEVEAEYVTAVDWATLLPVEEAAPGTLFAVAARVGSTRLIDNTIL
jgi:pantoate--beta-alanine ligase